MPSARPLIPPSAYALLPKRSEQAKPKCAQSGQSTQMRRPKRCSQISKMDILNPSTLASPSRASIARLSS
eukprot:1517610-Karenia_brevis.AAC.1